MRRREFMLLLGGLMTAAHTTGAQQKAMPLIGFLTPRTFEANTSAFRRGPRELGYLEGQNVALEVRSAEGDYRRLPTLAAEPAALKPDAIVTNSFRQSARYVDKILKGETPADLTTNQIRASDQS